MIVEGRDFHYTQSVVFSVVLRKAALVLPRTGKKWTLQGPTQINRYRSYEKITNLCFNKSHDADPSKSPLSAILRSLIILVSLIALWCCAMTEKYSSLNCTLVPKTPLTSSLPLPLDCDVGHSWGSTQLSRFWFPA